MIVTPELKTWLIDNGHCEADQTDAHYKRVAVNLMTAGTLSDQKFIELSTGEKDMTSPTDKLFEGRDGNVRVKSASEQYSKETFTLNGKHGKPVFDPIYGREVRSQSERAKARIGTLFKHLAKRAGIIDTPLSEHERELLTDLCENEKWAGKIGDEYFDSITGHKNIKALLDDQTSGGLEITPIEFDEAVITVPLLSGELFPDVDLKPVPRGRRIEGAAISNVSMAWGGGDATDITLFNTASMVAALDTSIFVIDGAITIGRDMLSDSPIAVGQTVTGLYGERLMQQLDYVIALGNGTTSPEGVFVKSGVGTVNTDNGSAGAPTIHDYTNLMFAVAKQYRKAAYKPVFLTNDIAYARSRAIKVDPSVSTTDQRWALDPMMSNYGAGVNAYSTLGWNHRIQQDLSNRYAAFVCLAKYRMYRRQGLEVRMIDTGSTLARANEVLMTYRARFGGKLMDASACAKWTDGQS